MSMSVEIALPKWLTWAAKLRIWNAAGHVLHIQGIPILTIQTDDYVVDFGRILADIHAAEIETKICDEGMKRAAAAGDSAELDKWQRRFSAIKCPMSHTLLLISNNCEMFSTLVPSEGRSGDRWNRLHASRISTVRLAPPEQAGPVLPAPRWLWMPELARL
jgi:hypothetical protein